MYRKVIAIVKVTLCSMALIGLLTACGSTTNVEGVESAVKNEVVESITVVESETTTTESEANTEKDVVEESKEVTTETNVAVESKPASVEGDKYPNYNGSHAEETLQETEQTYIQYTDIDPTTMYVINTNNMDLSVYRDPNITGGVLMEGGVVESNQEIIIDGKGTFNNVDYYRIAYKEGSMISFQLIIPAEFITTEQQSTPVETIPDAPKSETPQTQPEAQQPTENQKPVENEPTTPSTEFDGMSEQELQDLLQNGPGGATAGGHTWQPDHPDTITIERNENGGFTITGSGLSQEILERSGNQVVH